MDLELINNRGGKDLRVYESPVIVKSQVENENGICNGSEGKPMDYDKVQIEATEQTQGDIIDVSDNSKNDWY